MWQVGICQAGGGTATVDVNRTVEGIESTKVTCRGGLAGGVQCFNGKGDPFCISTDAVSSEAGSQIWPVFEVISVLETGSVHQFNELLTDLEAANAGGQDVAPAENDQGPAAQASFAGADQDHDQDTTTSKGKKGKKGGKGRK